MKIMFNEIGGKVVRYKFPYCNDCIFNHTKFCEDIDIQNPLFISCIEVEFIETNLDIFEL